MVDHQDVVYSGFNSFHQAVNVKRLNSLCERYSIRKPDGINDPRTEAKVQIWNALCQLAKEPHEIDVKKASKPAKASNKGSTGSRVKYPDDWIITVLAPQNPRYGDAARRFALYQTGMTVGQYLEAGGTRNDVNWDSKNDWIKVEPPQ